jgi:cellulose synthase/poly-beta-1,6-N-acetylglucosamine synthase-like glycosyltransferase
MKCWLLLGFVGTFLAAGIAAGLTETSGWAWVVGYFFLVYDSVLLGIMVIEGRRELSQPNRPASEAQAGGVPVSLTLVVCARNERLVLPACLEAARIQSIPADEVILVDDGSWDGTSHWLESEWGVSWVGREGRSRVWPGLRILRLPPQGKASALNEGWRAARGEVVVTLDADTVMDRAALESVRRAFEKDGRLAAACAVLIPRCAPSLWSGWFGFFQRFEYLRSFLQRLAFMRHDMLLLVSGAFSAYRREALEAIGGFRSDSLVEDYDLIYRLHRHDQDFRKGWRVRVIAGASAVTDAPGEPIRFFKQRERWFAGFLETLFRNPDMVANPRYGPVGCWMLPLKVIDTLVPLYGLFGLGLLIYFLLRDGGWWPLIWAALGFKLAYDIAVNYWAVLIYQRWTGHGPPAWQGVLAALSEPLGFHLLRQAGAALGWWVYLRGCKQWAPQRPSSHAAPAARVPAAEGE